MSLYESEEIIKLKRTIDADLFEQVSINFSFSILNLDKQYGLTTPLLTKKDLTPLLAKVYLYFLQPIHRNRYHNYAYDFFDARLRQVKQLNPLKNVYEYGKITLDLFLNQIPELELFFRNMYDFYIDYLIEIKYLKRIDFNEKAIFKSTIVNFLSTD